MIDITIYVVVVTVTDSINLSKFRCVNSLRCIIVAFIVSITIFFTIATLDNNWLMPIRLCTKPIFVL